MTTVLAVDIGGTKLAAALVGGDGTVRHHRQVATPRAQDGHDPTGDDVLGVLLEVVDEVRSATTEEPAAVGVGCGGPMDRGGEHVSPVNIPAWRAFGLRFALAAHTGLPVWVDNDAKALALGEGWLGAARGCGHFLAMVVSTGVGGGIVLDGRLLDGAAGNAGHVGHVIVEPDGRRCGCGARGCLEAEASGTAIEAVTGRPAAEAGPDIVVRTGTLVGRGVASVANLLDLPLVVVGGSVALGFGDPFFTAAQREVDARCRLEFARGTRVVPAGLGAEGPLVGAAAVARRRLPGAPPGLVPATPGR